MADTTTETHTNTTPEHARGRARALPVDTTIDSISVTAPEPDPHGPLLTSRAAGYPHYIGAGWARSADPHLPLYLIRGDPETNGSSLRWAELTLDARRARALRRGLRHTGHLIQLTATNPVTVRIRADWQLTETTAGRHLHIGALVTWKAYRRTLIALANAGLIDGPWADQTLVCRVGALADTHPAPPAH